MMLLRKHAALWAAAGILGLVGAATSFAAAGFGAPPSEQPSPGPVASQAVAGEPMPLAQDQPGGSSEGQADPTGEPDAHAQAMPGVPQDSPACQNVGCGEVENAGGVALHLPQPAVDGITRAAVNREAAQNRGQQGTSDDPSAADTAATQDEGPANDTVRGVPEDSPACENVGCGEVTNAGGVNLHLPQPAVDGINRAREHREAAQDKKAGGDPGDEPGVTSTVKPGGRPDHAGKP